MDFLNVISSRKLWINILDGAPLFAVGVNAVEDSFGGVDGLAVLFAFEECNDVVQALGRVGNDNILQFQLRKETAKLNPENWLGR